MAKQFERALLLSSDRHSLYDYLIEILRELAVEAKSYDIHSSITGFGSFIQSQILKAPFSVRARWEKSFQGNINKKLLEVFRTYSPDVVMVYNSEFLLPETCAEIRKTAKLIFYLADSPFYTPLNNFYLTDLTYADLILSPDTFWANQLNTIGLSKTMYFIPGPDKKSYHKIDNPAELADTESREVLYAGSSYFTSWGYKKALFMSKFTPFDFHLYGNNMWRRWFSFFPELEKSFTEAGYIKTEVLNKMFNKARIVPVDGNPGILNGFHLRAFEALGAGALPLIEYRSDIDGHLFKGCDCRLPLIKDYNKATETARYYLYNENERLDMVKCLNAFIETTYNKKRNAELITAALEMHNRNSKH